MNRIVLLIALLAIFVMSGCLFIEAVEVRIRFPGKDQPPEVTLIYHNISSDAENQEKLQKDFEELLEYWQSKKDSTELAEDGLLLQHRDIDIIEGKLQVKTQALLTGTISEAFGEGGQSMIEAGISSNGERILIMDGKEADVTATNGKVFKTGKNYIVVWPEDLTEIYWIQRMRHSPDDVKQAQRNRPAFINMFNHYVQAEQQSQAK